MNKELSNKIYYTSFVLALFVMVFHASYLDFLDPTLPSYDVSYMVQRIFFVLGDAAVPTFFVISGYLLFAKFTLQGYPKMLLNKVFSLVIPYFFWSIFAFVFMQVLMPLMSGQSIEMTFQSAIVDILLSNSFPHLWFVRPLLVFFICSPLLYFVFKYLRKWCIFIPATLFFVYMFFRPEYGGTLIWIPFFFIGAYLSYFKVAVMNPLRPRLFGGIALAIWIAVAFVLSYFHSQYENIGYYCYRFASPLLIWFTLDLMRSLFEKESVHAIFKTSGFIFFSHLGMTFLSKMALEKAFPPNSNLNCLILFALVFLVSATLELLGTYLLQRFARPVYRFLGGR